MNPLFSGVLGSAVLALFLSGHTVGHAAEKPHDIDQLWQIIQQQQQQIDALNRKLDAQAEQIAVSNQSPATPARGRKQDSGLESPDIKEVARKTNILGQEVEKLRTALVIPEEKALKSAYGLGPAASKIYQTDKGLSIGGYGEAYYRNYVTDNASSSDTADMYRQVIYLGYRFNDNILFNSELEFEHGSTGSGGTVSVEFANVDFLLDPRLNVRAGMVLSPMGFINQIHEPNTFFGNIRPKVEQTIIPSTWREMGVGLFGQLSPGLTYTTYVMNGLNAANFSASGIRSGRQNGSKVKAEDLAWVGRLDYTFPSHQGLSLGASVYLGDSGQSQTFSGTRADVFTQLYEGHVQWRYRGLEFRALGAYGHIDDAGVLSAAKGETVGESNYGWYTELGYNILPLILKDTGQYLAPFVRYEHYDSIAKAPAGYSDDLSKDQEIYQIGLQYKPIPNVVVKADYRNFTAEQGSVADEFNLGLGYVF